MKLAFSLQQDRPCILPTVSNVVVLHLHDTLGREVRQIGPFPWVRLVANSLRAGPSSEEIGQYRGGSWHIAADTGVRLCIRGSDLFGRFEADHEVREFGPFDRAESFNGAIRSYPGSVLVALFDEERKLWYAYDRGRWWPGLILGNVSLDGEWPPLACP
jgi:hypothetical protein